MLCRRTPCDFYMLECRLEKNEVECIEIESKVTRKFLGQYCAGHSHNYTLFGSSFPTWQGSMVCGVQVAYSCLKVQFIYKF